MGLKEEWDASAPSAPIKTDLQSEWDAAAPVQIQPPIQITGGISDALSKRAENIGDIWSMPTNDPRMEPSVMNAFTRSPAIALQTMGQVAGGVNDIVGAGLKAGYQNLVPEGVRGFISERNKAVMGGLDAPPVRQGAMTIADLYAAAQKRYPEAVKNVEAVANISGVVPTGWASKEGAGIIKGAVTPVVNLANVEKKIDQAITNGIQKGIKPTVVGKSDAGLVRKYYENARTAVRDIVDASPIKLSQSENILDDFAQAVKDTKIKLHQQYSQMAVGAGGKGAMVDLSPVIDDMKALAINANVNRVGGGIPELLAKKIREWESLPTMVSPLEAEELIAGLNQQAKTFWKDPTSHTTAASIERIAQQTRKQTFDAIERYEGPGYSELRKRYGAQLALEKEVANRAMITGRRAPYGFFDLANIPAASEFVGALATGRPLGIAKAGAILTAKSFMQSRNDPSNIIRKMFKDVETLNAIKRRYTGP